MPRALPRKRGISRHPQGEEARPSWARLVRDRGDDDILFCGGRLVAVLLIGAVRAVVEGLARLAIVVGVQPVRIALVALVLRLGFFLGSEVRAVELVGLRDRYDARSNEQLTHYARDSTPAL